MASAVQMADNKEITNEFLALNKELGRHSGGVIRLNYKGRRKLMRKASANTQVYLPILKAREEVLALRMAKLEAADAAVEKITDDTPAEVVEKLQWSALNAKNNLVAIRKKVYSLLTI
jgi:hypothetical protein